MKIGISKVQVFIPAGINPTEVKDIKESIMVQGEGKQNKFFTLNVTAEDILKNACSGYIITAAYDYYNNYRLNDNLSGLNAVIIDIDNVNDFTYDDFKKSELFKYAYATYPSVSNQSNTNFRIIIKLSVILRCDTVECRKDLIEFYRELVKHVTTSFEIKYDPASEKISQMMYGCKSNSRELFPEMFYANEEAVLPMSYLDETRKIMDKMKEEAEEQKILRQVAADLFRKANKKDKNFDTLVEKMKSKFFDRLVETHLVKNWYDGNRHNSALNFASLALQDGHDEYEIWRQLNLTLHHDAKNDADYYIKQGRRLASKHGYNIPTNWELYTTEILEKKKKPREVFTVDPIKRLVKSTILSEYGEHYRRNFSELCNAISNKDMNLFVKLPPIAIDWCKSKNIPELVYSKWFFAPKGKFADRVVIPFYDDTNKMYFFQAISIFDDVKYIRMNPYAPEIPIYNMFNINLNKPVIVTGYVTDSLFIDNSVSVYKCDENNIKSVPVSKENLYVILSNNKYGRKTSLELLHEGFNVFLWQKYIKEERLAAGETISELITKNGLSKISFSQSDLKKYFSSLIVDKTRI